MNFNNNNNNHNQSGFFPGPAREDNTPSSPAPASGGFDFGSRRQPYSPQASYEQNSQTAFNQPSFGDYFSGQNAGQSQPAAFNDVNYDYTPPTTGAPTALLSPADAAPGYPGSNPMNQPASTGFGTNSFDPNRTQPAFAPQPSFAPQPEPVMTSAQPAAPAWDIPSSNQNLPDPFAPFTPAFQNENDSYFTDGTAAFSTAPIEGNPQPYRPEGQNFTMDAYAHSLIEPQPAQADTARPSSSQLSPDGNLQSDVLAFEMENEAEEQAVLPVFENDKAEALQTPAENPEAVDEPSMSAETPEPSAFALPVMETEPAIETEPAMAAQPEPEPFMSAQPMPAMPAMPEYPSFEPESPVANPSPAMDSFAPFSSFGQQPQPERTFTQPFPAFDDDDDADMPTSLLSSPKPASAFAPDFGPSSFSGPSFMDMDDDDDCATTMLNQSANTHVNSTGAPSYDETLFNAFTPAGAAPSSPFNSGHAYNDSYEDQPTSLLNATNTSSSFAQNNMYDGQPTTLLNQNNTGSAPQYSQSDKTINMNFANFGMDFGNQTGQSHAGGFNRFDDEATSVIGFGQNNSRAAFSEIDENDIVTSLLDGDDDATSIVGLVDGIERAKAPKPQKNEPVKWIRAKMGSLPAPTLILENTETAQNVCISQAAVLVGRGEICDWQIDSGTKSNTISRQHAWLTYEESHGCWAVQDISKTGIRVNNTSQNPANYTLLKEGDLLQFGYTAPFRVHFVPQ